MKEQEYVITMLVANKPSVTSRVTALFSGRGYNMDSICGAPTHDPEISRITIKTTATPEKLDEIMAHLDRLIDVIKLRDMTDEERAVKREMALISVKAEQNSSAVKDIISTTEAKILSDREDSIIAEITGTEDEVNSLVEKLSPFGILKLARSGILALYRDVEST